MTKEQKRKNWVEKYYRLNPKMESRIILENRREQMKARKEGEITKKQIENAVKAVNMSLYSILDQYVSYIEEQPNDSVIKEESIKLAQYLRGNKPIYEPIRET